ncbi:MAG: dTDP-4-dehydrorhamnose reductase [Chitinophagaceae bacterium]|nr:dTDP-4-dehydrorhamnose reductase [Chitinophagaceae bacterium]
MNSDHAHRGLPVVLVTGANGQLGRELQDLAPQHPQYQFIFLSRDQLRIDQEAEVRSAVSLHHPGFCINCAAYTAVDKAESEKEEAFLINAKAVGNLAAICREYGARFIHISTDYVFDGIATEPYKESDQTDPVNIYGASKLEGERVAMKNNPESLIIRTSWVYSSYGKNFVKTMLRLMREKDELNVVNDQYGSPTYAADLADVILQIVNKAYISTLPGTIPAGIFHYSNDAAITWFEFAIAIRDLIRSKCTINPISTADFPTPAKRPGYAVLDKASIQDAFGIELKDWKQSLASCLKLID